MLHLFDQLRRSFDLCDSLLGGQDIRKRAADFCQDIDASGFVIPRRQIAVQRRELLTRGALASEFNELAQLDRRLRLDRLIQSSTCKLLRPEVLEQHIDCWIRGPACLQHSRFSRPGLPGECGQRRVLQQRQGNGISQGDKAGRIVNLRSLTRRLSQRGRVQRHVATKRSRDRFLTGQILRGRQHHRAGQSHDGNGASRLAAISAKANRHDTSQRKRFSCSENELRYAAARAAGRLGGRSAGGEYPKRGTVYDRRVERVAVAQRAGFRSCEDEHRHGRDRQNRVRRALGHKDRRERPHSPMVTMIERPGMFDRIVDEVNKRLPRNQLMQMGCWHNRKRQHGGNRVDRQADPEDSPLQQDFQYTGGFALGVKAENGRRVTLAVVRKSRSSQRALFSNNDLSEETGQVETAARAWRAQACTPPKKDHPELLQQLRRHLHCSPNCGP